MVGGEESLLFPSGASVGGGHQQRAQISELTFPVIGVEAGACLEPVWALVSPLYAQFQRESVPMLRRPRVTGTAACGSEEPSGPGRGTYLSQGLSWKTAWDGVLDKLLSPKGTQTP